MTKKIMSRFTQLPLTLYRIQAKMPVNIRNYDSQMKLGRTSFDLKLHDQKVLPIKPNTAFETPNGMSLRPASQNMLNVLENFREPTIYVMLTGLRLPEGFCIYHEHTDHYSLQTTEPISLPELNQKMTEFLKTLPSMTKYQFIEQMNDEEDHDC